MQKTLYGYFENFNVILDFERHSIVDSKFVAKVLSEAKEDPHSFETQSHSARKLVKILTHSILEAHLEVFTEIPISYKNGLAVVLNNH